MKKTSFEEEISISNLLLDTQNPRLPNTQSSQYDAIRAITNTQAEKIMSLAHHIVEYGINPASLPIVMPTDDENRFLVLDGNRRITALNLLLSPTLADGILNPSSREKLNALSKKFAIRPILNINCIVVTD